MKEAISAFVPSTINWNIGVDAHILVAFLAYRLIVTLKHRARPVCAGTDAARRAGKAGLDSDARRDPAHHRWPPIGDAPPHRTRSRSRPAAPSPQPHPASSTASAHQPARRGKLHPIENVVRTFGLP